MKGPGHRPVKTLHLDIEGGWGGSSRSLFELVSRFDYARVSPLVALAQKGPAIDRYRGVGIPTIIEEGIQSYVPRKKAWLELLLRAPRLLRTFAGSQSLCAVMREHQIDVVHLNYEGLFVLGWQLRRRCHPSIVTHFRASRVSTGQLGRLLAKSVADISDHVFCISPIEMDWFERMAPNDRPPAEVLWNVAGAFPERRPLYAPPRIVSLGNIDRQKGVDRLLDVAEALDNIGAPAAIIEIYGEARTDSQFARTLADDIARRRLGARVQLKGFIADPREMLAGAFLLLRPSRWDDPWGRDVIEATAAGCPVIATGTYDGVVKEGRTGHLVSTWDAEKVASLITYLLKDPERHAQMVETCLAEGDERFSGREQAERAMRVFETLAAHQPSCSAA